ncbi:MAG: hypothetical protein IKD80_06625, partial [Selenomonadaceae bacterium]|nr:hypothetical protein [Selenomonadaceae bacterium]
MQRFAVTQISADGVYTLTTDRGTLKLSGLNYDYMHQLEFNEANNFVDVGVNAVAENGTLTVVENSAGYDIRLWGQNFTLVGSSGNDGFIFGNEESNVTIQYTVGSSGNYRISSVADIAMTTVKLQFVTNDNKPVAYSTKWSGNNLIVTVGDNTITYVNFGAGNVSVDNGVGLETIDGLNVNVDETGNGYYKISSATDLQTLANYVNSGGYTSGKVFKLTGDIDMSGVENFTPIGNNNNQFGGTFDGNGFTIRNLTINGGTNSYVGLFGDNSGTIQNVKLDNVNVSGGNYYVGGLVGLNSGTVTNCTVTNATVSGTTNVGGLIGYNDHPASSVTDNAFDGTVSGN